MFFFKKKLIVLLILGVLMGLPFEVLAHLPVFSSGNNESISQAQEIFEPETAQIIFGKLAAGKINFYKFFITKPFNLHLQFLVPQNSQNVNFRPTLALFGPGLNKNNDYLPFFLKEDWGAVILYDKQKTKRETIFDYETLTRYFKIYEIRQYLTEPNNYYYLALFDLENRSGSYVIKISDKEKWSLKSLGLRLKGILKIKLGLL